MGDEHEYGNAHLSEILLVTQIAICCYEHGEAGGPHLAKEISVLITGPALVDHRGYIEAAQLFC